MPLIIVSLLFQILLCWHAARSGRAQPWIWIILVFPGVGGAVYVATRYPGEEARCRQAMLLQILGRTAEAQAIFQAILRNARHRPSAQRRAQKPWEDIARSMVQGAGAAGAA